MSSAHVRTGIDSWTTQGTPSQHAGTGTQLRVQSGTDTKYTFIYLKCPAPRGATILSATLRLYSIGSGPAVTVNLQRVASPWAEALLTWNTQPGVAGAVVSLTQASASDATEWAFDVTDLVQLFASGTANFGFRLSTTTATQQKWYSLNSGDHRPVLDVEWSDAPDVPTELAPAGGAAVSSQFPTLTFNFTDVSGETAMQACQVQADAADNFADPDLDTGTVLTSDPELATAASMSRAATLTTTAGSTTVTAPAGTFTGNGDVGAEVTGANFAASTTIDQVVSDTEAVISAAATGTGTATATITVSWAGIAASATEWWRVRVQDSAGLWSDWSDAVHFTRVAKGALTIDNPAAAPNDFVSDVTPELSWTVTGATQTGRQVVIADDSDPTNHLVNTGRQNVAGNTYTPPKGVITDESVTYRLTLRTWDEPTRVKTPGDPIYLEQVRTFTFKEDPTPDPVTNLAAVQADSGLPRVALTWDRATAPDSFAVWRNGVVVDSDLDPADLFVSGTSYQYVDKTAQPAWQHTWKVRCKVNGVLGPGPSVTFQYEVPEVWLLDPDNDGLVVPILARADDKGAITYDMPEISGVYRPVDGNKVVRLVQGQYGLEGHIEGLIVDRAAFSSVTWVANMLTIKKHPENTYRLVVGGQNLPVLVGNVVISPPGGGGAPGDRRVAFDFWSLVGPVQK